MIPPTINGTISRTLRPKHCDPLSLYRTLGAGHEYCALLESADRAHGSNDRSFLALGAREVIITKDENRDPLTLLEGKIGDGSSKDYLQMGYIGFLSYESARLFESVELNPDSSIPDALFFMPEVILVIDHEKHEVQIIAHSNTTEDLDLIEKTILASPFFPDARDKVDSLKIPSASLSDVEAFRTVSREDYCAAVEEAKEGIMAGEVFQVVLSQELKLRSSAPPDAIYEALRAINPSPYMYCIRTPEFSIVGASPETLLRVQGRSMLYRPIAGTRKRTGDTVVDAAMQAELLADPKERAEHQMLVDLGRNDVGRVAKIGSVEVHDAFHIERYAHVFHIVSDITGILADDRSPLDALRSVFPAGTLTGAPKIRAMETIARLEGSPRGIYGGCLGYIDLSGSLDMAITIRTMLIRNGEISLRVGAGIVADSVPELEDNECLHKARSCLAAVTIAEKAFASAPA